MMLSSRKPPCHYDVFTADWESRMRHMIVRLGAVNGLLNFLDLHQDVHVVYRR